MASDTMTRRSRLACRLATLTALGLAASVGLGGCEQLKAIGAMVGLGGDEPQAAPSPTPGPRPAAATASTATQPTSGPGARTTASPLATPGARPAASPVATPGARPGALPAAQGVGTPQTAPAVPGSSPAVQQAAAASLAAARPEAGAKSAPAQPSVQPAASPAAPVVAVNAPAAAGVAAPQRPGLPIAEDPFDPTGKRDPFRPFVTSTELAAQRAREQISPLQKLELSQLRLVAIVWGTRQNHAMVEDPGGVGYVLRVGTRVGPNGGRVSRIAPDAVYVEESFRDAAGSVLTNQITIRLPANPGGKGS